MNKVMQEVNKKHQWLEENKKKYDIEYVVMSTLIGSQNYGLSTEKSDVDVYSFTLPPFMSFIKNTTLISFEHTFEDGSKISVKDLRLACNLLRKPSPNSVECFVSHYQVFNPLFENELSYWLNNNYYLRYLTHCDYKNMVNAIAGCAKGLHGRNMLLGKKYAHALRLHDMLLHYLDFTCEPEQYLTLESENLHAALSAKLGLLPVNEISYNNLVNTLNTFAKNYTTTEREQLREINAKATVDNFQKGLTKIYLQNVNI